MTAFFYDYWLEREWFRASKAWTSNLMPDTRLWVRSDSHVKKEISLAR
jgi:hypothetical protein